MLSVFTFKCFFFDSTANTLSGFSFICISFVCYGQEDDEEVKVDGDWLKNTAGNCPTLRSVSGPECWLVAKNKTILMFLNSPSSFNFKLPK